MMVPEDASISDLCFEEARLKTYTRWPFSKECNCNAQKMAEAGFYACGGPTEPDLVACFLCGKQLDGWEESDDPWDEHRKHKADCAFVKINKKQDDMTYREFFRNVFYPYLQAEMRKHGDKLLAGIEDAYKQIEEQVNNQ